MSEPHNRVPDGDAPSRGSIPRPADEQVVIRVAAGEDVEGATRRKKFDLAATLAGALAALGTLLLLSSLLGTFAAVGFQRGVEGQTVSIGGLVAGLVALTLACLVGGWVAGRMAQRRGGLHGLVAALWLVALAAALALLAALAGDDADIRDRVGLPNWFGSEAATGAAIGTGLLALALMLLAGWLGGRLGERHHDHEAVEVVETRRRVRRVAGGIVTKGDR